MKLSKGKCWSILILVVLSLFVLGCSAKQGETPSKTEQINLNLGAVLKSEDGSYKLYNYEDGKYGNAKSNSIVLTYDKSSSNYVTVEDGKDYVVSAKNKFEIKDSNYSELKLSKGGKYISYFIDDDGLKLKVFDTSQNKQIEIKSNVSISGILYDWYDTDTLIYYGVSDDGVNGLFIYNIKENKEELLYNIKNGYLAYLKGIDNNVVFIQLTLENKKELMMINKQTKEVKLLSNDIEELTDVEIYNNKIYFTGKATNNVDSLYELDDNKAKRLVFDFPAVVKVGKGLEIDENGNILFIGANKLNDTEEQIYTYTKDGSISSVSKNSTDYAFIDYKS